MATPSSSSTSAVPQAEDAARLPCLTTARPDPAVTSAAMVEMFTVWARSPPVPTTSTAGWLRATGVGPVQHGAHQAGQLRRGLTLGAQ